MRLHIDLLFRSLQRIQPSEESGDEPYLWTFFLKFDRSTVRQLASGGFVGSIQVVTAAGSHGNLGGASVAAVPPGLGGHSGALGAVPMRFGSTQMLFPGKLIVLAVLLEEDLNPTDAEAEACHQSLRNYFEQQFNAFVAQLDVNEVVAAAGGGSPVAVIEQRLTTLAAKLAHESKQFVDLDFLASGSALAFWERIDLDDHLAAAHFIIDEGSILNTPPGHTLPAKLDLMGLEDGHIAAWYILRGTQQVTITGDQPDLVKTGDTIGHVFAEEGTATFTEAQQGLCVTAGTQVIWTRTFLTEVESFRYVYPFISAIRFQVDGQDLLGSPGVPGSVVVSTVSSIPRFDISSPGKPVWDSATRNVTVQFVIDADGRGVQLSNVPSDGSYTVTLSVIGTIGGPSGDTQVTVASATASFDGQMIESTWYDEYKQCIDRFREPSDRFSESKRVTPKDLWGPTARRAWLKDLIDQGEALVTRGEISLERFELGTKQLIERAALKSGE